MNNRNFIKTKTKYQYTRNVPREQLRKRTNVYESKQGRRRSVGQCSLVIKCVLVFGFHSLLWMSHIPYFLNFFTHTQCVLIPGSHLPSHYYGRRMCQLSYSSIGAINTSSYWIRNVELLRLKICVYKI